MRYSVFAALLVLASMGAQPREATWSCVNQDARWSRKPTVRFEVESDPSRAASLRKLPSKSIDGFAASYGISQITFYLATKASENRLQTGEADVWADVTTVGGVKTLYHLLPSAKC